MENEKDIAIKIKDLKKQYRLGVIGGGTLQGDIQSWWARVRGKEDPNLRIGKKAYGKNETFMALDGIDLTVYKGERLGIIGHNGAGKSTLLKLLSRVTAPTEGEICIDGRVSSMLEVGTGFNRELTGRENIYLNGAILGMTTAEVDSKIDQIIEFSECAKFIDTPVKRYSSGMYVKLAFAVAAHLDSEILIMDEVLAVGDMAFQKKCLNKMSEVSKSEGRTVLYVSHNMNTIRQLCDRCIVLDHGKIIFNGDVEKAIQIYLRIDFNTDYPIYYDLKKIERLFHFGKRVLLTDFEFLNKQAAVYEVGEKIRFSVTLDSKIDLQDVQIIVPVKDENYKNIGMTFSDPFDIKKGTKQKFVFETVFDGLTDGPYCISVGLIKRGYAGRYHAYDDSGANILIELTNPQAFGIEWKKEFWGSIKFNDIKLI